MEIQVRAWHKLLKEYVKLNKFSALTADSISSTDCDLELFTGYTGEDGVDVFVGDITQKNYLTNDAYESGAYSRGQIVLHNRAFMECYTHANGSKYYDEIKDCFVVGNINQNPELLK